MTNKHWWLLRLIQLNINIADGIPWGASGSWFLPTEWRDLGAVLRKNPRKTNSRNLILKILYGNCITNYVCNRNIMAKNSLSSPGVTRPSGQTNPKYDSTFVFQNDFPALLEEVPTPQENDDDPLFRAGAARGTCRVMVIIILSCYFKLHNQHIVWKLLKMSHLSFGIFHQFLSY